MSAYGKHVELQL